MKYTTILFDLDGTLTESGIGIRRSFEYALDKLFPGKIFEEHLFSGIVGPPLIYSFGETFGFDPEMAEKAVSLYRERYSTIGIFENALYEGVSDMLQTLYSKGYTICLATSKPEAFAGKILEHFNISNFFTFVGGATMDGSRNSKIAVLEHVLENISEKDKSKILMIGDKHQIGRAHV